MKKLFVIFISVVVIAFAYPASAFPPFGGDDHGEIAASDSFPVPAGNPNQLFYLQRTPNTNTIVYETNLDAAGKLNADEPIHVFWIRYPEGGGRKELNYIQRHFAYGVSAEAIDDGRYRLTFTAYKKRNFYLAFAPRDNKYHVYGNINNKVSMLIRVFIQIDPGGSFWSPNVKYIDIKGRELASGREITERIWIAR